MDATFWLVLAIFLGVLQVSFHTSQLSDTALRLKRVERRVDLILNHLGLDPLQDMDQRVMKAGRKIAAIQEYRVQTGAGLKEAKDYVESRL